MQQARQSPSARESDQVPGKEVLARGRLKQFHHATTTTATLLLQDRHPPRRPVRGRAAPEQGALRVAAQPASAPWCRPVRCPGLVVGWTRARATGERTRHSFVSEDPPREDLYSRVLLTWSPGTGQPRTSQGEAMRQQGRADAGFLSARLRWPAARAPLPGHFRRACRPRCCDRCPSSSNSRANWRKS